jgi:hypothetical protein
MFGSFRYRMRSSKRNIAEQAAKALQEGRQQQWAILMRRDTLTAALRRHAAFRGFGEPQVQFLPTSPMVRPAPREPVPDTSGALENRDEVVEWIERRYLDHTKAGSAAIPSYPERILSQSKPQSAHQLTCIDYSSSAVEYTRGSNNPVLGLFQLG